MQPVNGRRYSSWPSKNNPGTPPLCWRTPDLKVGANSITRDSKSHPWAKDRCWTQREAAATLFVFHLFWSDCARARARMNGDASLLHGGGIAWPSAAGVDLRVAV